ncbi:MAG: class IV adenylate cyclase, partial [Planctomycetes bacterium]|nr:class IV adenylate cyclase [Planctomycetota bacterium]
MACRRNVELKARVTDLGEVRRRAVEMGARAAGVQRQRDTYFHVPRGRLKLREIEGEPAVLIQYSRPDAAGARRSDYHLVPVAEAELLKAALGEALEIRNVVEKRREIFLYQPVERQGGREGEAPAEPRFAEGAGSAGASPSRSSTRFYRNVRIHLDEVAGLGSFLEFEAVLEPGQPEQDGHAVLE